MRVREKRWRWNTRGTGWIAAIATMMLVSACATPDDWFGRPEDGYPDNSQQLANDADWASAKTVAVDLSEFSYTPRTLTFRAGRPYALELTNSGVVAHRFMARGFFRGIAAKSIVYGDGEASYPLLEAITLEPQETKTLYFVPVIPGDYHASCDQPLHSVLGMAGRIVIE